MIRRPLFSPAPPPAPESQDGPSVARFIALSRRQNMWITIASVLLSLALGGLFVSMSLDSPLLPIILLLSIALPIILFYYPRAMFWLMFGGVCLFELFPTGHPDAITDRIPFFWNVNTILEVYAHVNPKLAPISLMELLLLLTGIGALLRAVYFRQMTLRGGPLLVPMMIYIGFVTMGWINGMMTGGDFKISLQEVRSQFYLFLAYLMSVNFVTEKKHARGLLWVAVLCIGLKGILYTYRRYVTMAGMELPDQGVGSHEEAFLFSAFAMLLLTLSLSRALPKMRYVLWSLLPIVVLGNLACNRRAGTAAVIIALPIVFAAAYRCLPDRRKFIRIAAIVLGVCFSIYYPIFRNSDSGFALPARAIRSQFQPNERDASSNAYRDAENANLILTMRLSPIIGYGYGKKMLHTVPMADIAQIYEWWDILPHNQILWVWMRVGTLGFLAFWTMIAAILVRACLLLRDDNVEAPLDPESKGILLFVLSLIPLLILFGLLDLQLSNYRDMLFVGVFVGLLGSRLYPVPKPETAFPMSAPAPTTIPGGKK
jgi:hypothetical protein